MEQVILGRTGLLVSRAGLGCGGHSQLGRGYGATHDHSVDIVKAAIDMGITFIDTANAYGTEEIVGDAISGKRDQVVISTKGAIVPKYTSGNGTDYISADELLEKLESSLTKLKTDYIDIYHLHGIKPHQYDVCVEQFLPALERMQKAGKIRFIGLTERFIVDPQHSLLQRAISDNYWDVVMVGFNMINPSARKTVLPMTTKHDVGVLNMFAVRNALGSMEKAKPLLQTLAADGHIIIKDANNPNLLAAVVAATDSNTLTEAAYRFCCHEPGNQVILTGTGNVNHLKQNIDAISKPALPDDVLDYLENLFGHIDSVSGD